MLYLGRFSPEKNCHLLIAAFENVRTPMKLVLAGGSSHSDSYVESLLRHRSERIRFLPWVAGDELDELLSNAALFVLPSDIEGLSLALLDAMAAGVCVLTSDIPENKEVASGAGFTFERGSRADLECMLDLLLHHPELRREAAVKGLQRMEKNYLWPGIARSIEEAYLGVLGWQRPAEILGSPIGVETGGPACEHPRLSHDCLRLQGSGAGPGSLKAAACGEKNMYPLRHLRNRYDASDFTPGFD